MTNISLERTLEIAVPSLEIPDKVAKAIISKANEDADQNIGGFQITDPLLVQDRMKHARVKRQEAVEQFGEDRDILKKRITSLGIEKYLAIVPTVYWKNICDRHQLMTVEPQLRGGAVSVFTGVPWHLMEKAKKPWETMSGIFCGLAVLSGMITVFVMFNSGGIHSLLPLGVTLVLGLMTAGFYFVGVERGKRAIRRHLKETPYSKLLQELLVRDKNRYRWTEDYSSKLVFPEPPAEIVFLLRKLREGAQGFSVTAEPEAIRLDPSVDELFLRGHKMEQERIFEENRDPIITIEYHGATAVLAQFGDFKWELEAIEDVVSSTPLPIRN